MARALFSNSQLCRAWRQVAAAKGVRMDVVEALLEETETESNEKTRAQFYSVVSQRVKSLQIQGITFQALENGRRGGRKNDIEALQAILDAEEDGGDDDGEDTDDEE